MTSSAFERASDTLRSGMLSSVGMSSSVSGDTWSFMASVSTPSSVSGTDRSGTERRGTDRSGVLLALPYRTRSLSAFRWLRKICTRVPAGGTGYLK
jgi:hypothetical protein